MYVYDRMVGDTMSSIIVTWERGGVTIPSRQPYTASLTVRLYYVCPTRSERTAFVAMVAITLSSPFCRYTFCERRYACCKICEYFR